MKKLSLIILLISIFSSSMSYGQKDSVISIYNVHSNLYLDTVNNAAFFMLDSVPAYEVFIPSKYTLDWAKGDIKGTTNGLFFEFNNEEFNGKLMYGFIPHGDSKYPHPVYFRSSADIKQGRTAINISQVLRGRYDMVGWEKKGYGTIGYRLTDADGQMIYDGKVTFKGTGPFEVAPTLIEGPFVNLVTPTGATISFDTNFEITGEVVVDGKSYKSKSPSTHHEIEVKGLNEDTEYEYSVKYGDISESYSFQTAPSPGTRSSYSFAYASDSRSGNGGGERDVYGANFYIMKKIMSLARFKGVRFTQFSGDMINGYLTERGAMDLQYSNWKRAIEPFTHYFPMYISMGNHEALMRVFRGNGPNVMVDRFPFESESGEAAFASHFVNPTNGPAGEDGAKYDPNPARIDFPTYKENVFYYTFDNTAVVVLNSDYWYAPSTGLIPKTGGGLHGYIMDNQLKWLRKTIKSLEKDKAIDHVFITQHTPMFPNGGHVGDDMWYRGNNSFRPYVNGKPLPKGIIERRDEILQIIVNESTKVIAVMTGDEHNYCRTEIGPETVIYPEDWEGEKLELSRTIFQVNNGAAGAPYYAQEQTPWTPFTSSFTTQNALVFFHIEGGKIEMEVLNPDTLETIEEFSLR
jgi:3',5'-cyclic AMP phosphodiesterase CpdA